MQRPGHARPFLPGAPSILVPVFDGHNDVLLRLWNRKVGDPVAAFLNGDGQGHMDLPRMVKGGFAGGFFAIFAPSPEDEDDDDDLNPPPSHAVAQAAAAAAVTGMASLLFRIEEAAPDRFKVCRSTADIRSALADGKIAAAPTPSIRRPMMSCIGPVARPATTEPIRINSVPIAKISRRPKMSPSLPPTMISEPAKK